MANEAVFLSEIPNIPITVFNPGNPSGTTSLTEVMMGLGGTVTYTPTTTGRVQIMCFAQFANNTANDGVTGGLRTNTGTAPSNGDALTGTQRGVTRTVTSYHNNQTYAVTLVSVASYTIGTAFWIDLAVKAITGGTASPTAISFLITEL